MVNISTDALGYTLALLTLGMSFVAVRYRNMLLTLGAATLWATLLAFILANTTAGTNWQSMFILAVVAFLCAFALISFFTRSRGDGSISENLGKLRGRDESEGKTSQSPRGIMDLDNTEYRQYLRSRMRKRGR